MMGVLEFDFVLDIIGPKGHHLVSYSKQQCKKKKKKKKKGRERAEEGTGIFKPEKMLT